MNQEEQLLEGMAKEYYDDVCCSFSIIWFTPIFVFTSIICSYSLVNINKWVFRISYFWGTSELTYLNHGCV